MFNTKILVDSLHPNGSRLTTFELTYPRFIHSELMTHRKFSRNSASSRAIPTKVILEQVENNPVIPIHWGKLQKGMQAYEELGLNERQACEAEWLRARDNVLESVRALHSLKLHKQIVNRLLEPWMWITVILTSDERGLANWFKLRNHEAAEPHIQKLARMMLEEYDSSKPKHVPIGAWHMPFSNNVKVSVARCARGSYLQHNGVYTIEDDEALHDKMAAMGHYSPFEHQAQATWQPCKGGNFVSGWLQYRKSLIGEHGCPM